ncbi:hypothetical protein BS47DRAFT_1369202 [Hydnum rufescens UP504]|uniref:Uncharacterized protein n=1 Tax=Hydnum rufescens UP504 TaxID=1448309 RepID=A0A9P6DMT2_9AGAM|nr:hypothetical protein BS47DRAFT_1369202 [Hydnum rufescens UP504]
MLVLIWMRGMCLLLGWQMMPPGRVSRQFNCLTRTGEEILRLCHEFHALVLWLTEESEAACHAQLNCKDTALMFQLRRCEKWLSSLGITWWAVMQKVQLGHDIPWPEHLRGSEKWGDCQGASSSTDGDEEIEEGVFEELPPEDTEVDDYLVEYIVQSRMEEDLGDWDDEADVLQAN